MKTVSSPFIRLALLVSLTTLATAPLLAQGRGSGPTPIGRQGATWQHGLDQAEEREAQLMADLDRLSDEEWRQKALAWVRFETEGAKSSTFSLPEAYRVGSVRATKADVAAQGPEDSPHWQINFGKKPPKSITLVLTDTGSTEVECKTAGAMAARTGHLGVFVHEGMLFCLPRSGGS